MDIELHTCPHCNQQTLAVIIPGNDPTVHCMNPSCGGFMATMAQSQYNAMSAAELNGRLKNRSHHAEHDDKQAEFEKRLAEIIAAAAKRAECRARGEQTFG